MVRNKEKYQQVVSLRKKGFTLEEIAKYCSISKSTVSRWLKGQDFSIKITKINTLRVRRENAKRLQIVTKIRYKERLQRYEDIHNSAKTEFNHYSKNLQFILGLSVYFSSGDINNKKIIRLSHKNPLVHRLFIDFCQEFLGINKSKIHFWIILSKNSNELEILKKWSNLTTISSTKFYKTQFLNPANGKNLHLGVGNIIINSVYDRCRLSTWIDLFKESILT